jgi:hypothetical protein
MDMERMILDAMPNARLQALRNRGPLEPDDAIGIAYLTLAEVAPRFDPTRGSTFWQFARLRVVGALKDQMRKYAVSGTRNNLAAVEVVTLDDEERPVAIPDGCNIEDRIIARVCVRRAVAGLKPRQAHAGMSGRGYAVACLLAAGWSTGDIRTEMQISHNRMGAAKTYAMLRMRQELGA